MLQLYKNSNRLINKAFYEILRKFS